MTITGTDYALDHFRFTLGDDGVAVALIDRAGERMNTLDPALATDLAAVIERCEQDDVAALVIGSAKPDNFLAGADMTFLREMESGAAADVMLADAHRLFARIERLHTSGTPVVAAIHGACLGGGLELALSCGVRIASDDEATTVLGLPEVKLGIIPGAGGTQRLPRLVGITAGLDMMLTGRSIRPRSALQMGLVDEIVPREHLLDIARRRARQGYVEGTKPISGPVDRIRNWLSPSHLQTLALEETAIGRRTLFSKAAERTWAQTRGHYPAPEAILRVVRTGVEKGTGAGYAAELEAFGELLATPEAQALLGVFADSQAAKKDPGAAATPHPVTKVGILGGGMMGAGIAAVTVTEAGIRTRIKELDDAGVGRGLAHVRRIVEGRVARRRIPRRDAERTMHLVTGSTDFSGLGDADVVIEAVFEDLEVKRSMLRDIERNGRENVIFASNTSSLPIAEIAATADRPEHVIGMHYFSPVEKMPLLEVVVTERTADWVTATCVALGKAQGKTVIVVNDGPGFYTTRILAPYMNEVGHLLSEGARIEDIDAAMIDWGFPVGPVTLMDEVGIDVGAKIARILHDAFGGRMAPPGNFARLLADDRRGRKNGRGFYRYENGEKRGVDDTVYEVLGGGGRVDMDPTDLQERLVSLFLNEAARCLEDGVLRSARDGDLGAVLGLGFPPFRGGPFTHIDRLGGGSVVAALDRLTATHGERYAAADILRDRAVAGTPFRD